MASRPTRITAPDPQALRRADLNVSVMPDTTPPTPNPEADATEWRAAHEAFQTFVSAADFPCIGAKSALNTGRYHFAWFDEMANPASARGVCEALYRFIAAYPDPGARPVTFVAGFRAPTPSEAVFESLLWGHLQAMHAVDREQHAWDERVSSDPDDPDFSLSIGGHGFFVVGLHPHASRWARRMPFDTLVFNFHSQFEALAEAGKYESMESMVRRRDLALQATPNPVLARHGEDSQARQYAGRAVPPGWRCPFHAQGAA